MRRAYEQLRELIVSGRLEPGERLVEADLGVRLRVSRTPIRTALHRLEQEGFVVRTGGHRESRLLVAGVTPEDARELFSMLGATEGLCARWAAACDAPVRQALAREMRDINARIAQASSDPTVHAADLYDLDVVFHRIYVEAGSGPRLRAQHNAIKPQAERYERVYRALVTDIGSAVGEHEAIVRAIEAGRPDDAQRAVEENWRNAAERLVRVIAARSVQIARAGGYPGFSSTDSGDARSLRARDQHRLLA